MAVMILVNPDLNMGSSEGRRDVIYSNSTGRDGLDWLTDACSVRFTKVRFLSESVPSLIRMLSERHSNVVQSWSG